MYIFMCVDMLCIYTFKKFSSYLIFFAYLSAYFLRTVCYGSPSSPPLRLSLLPRDTLHVPLRATSDRGSSPRLPGAHVTLLSAPPRTGGVPPGYRALAFPPPPPALSSRQAPPSFHTSPIRIPSSSITAPVPRLQSPSTPTKTWPALHSGPGLYQIQLAVKY